VASVCSDHQGTRCRSHASAIGPAHDEGRDPQARASRLEGSCSKTGEARRTLRAVAKIALHGALRLRPELVGDEWEFDVLRRFIRHGDLPSTNPVQYQNDRKIVGIADGVTLKDVGHVISVETTETALFTKLQFFTAPGAIPPPWVVRIGRRPQHIPSNSRVAYYARYFETPSADGHTGELIPLDQAERG
jgi:hypothetical protein